MTVSVVIPAYKLDDKLFKLIERLNKQTIIPNVILIVVTSKDGTNVQAYSKFNNVRIEYIENKEFDHGATRDMAVRMLEDDYVLLMTQDAIPANKHLIEELYKPFKSDDKIAVSFARQLPNDDCNDIERYIIKHDYPKEDCINDSESVWEKGIKAYFSSNVCALYNRAIYEKLGGFVKKIIFNEDSIYAATALENEYKTYYASGALVYYSHNYTSVQYFKRNFDLGVLHRQYVNIFDSKVKTEPEGIGLVKDITKYLIDNRKKKLIPKLIIGSGMKHMGYKLGKAYEALPKSIILKCTMNKKYWE